MFKMFKIALLDCVDGGWGMCPFLRPEPWGFDSSTVPALGNLLSKAKNANAWG